MAQVADRYLCHNALDIAVKTAGLVGRSKIHRDIGNRQQPRAQNRLEPI